MLSTAILDRAAHHGILLGCTDRCQYLGHRAAVSFRAWRVTGGKGWGLFDSQTTPGKALWRPLTHTFAQFGELMQTTPHKLTAVLDGPHAG